MATDPPGDVVLTPTDGEGKTLAEWLTTFHLSLVVLDPYTNESAWILDTAARVMRSFRGASVRVAFLCTADQAGTEQFLGPLGEEFLAFADPDRAMVKGLGLQHLPAWVIIRQAGDVLAAVEGWNGLEWRQVAKALAELTAWTYPLLPERGDPTPYVGTSALGTDAPA